METPAEVSIPTTTSILTALDETWSSLSRTLKDMAPVLSAGPDAGGWTPRQVISHIIGAWQRVPIHAAFVLADAPVPIQTDDDFWISEWETAPLAVFITAIQAVYEGNRRFIEQVTSADLARQAQTPFGTMTLGDLLLVLCHEHIAGVHIPQLEAFLSQ